MTCGARVPCTLMVDRMGVGPSTPSHSQQRQETKATKGLLVAFVAPVARTADDPGCGGPVTQSPEPTDRSEASVLSILSRGSRGCPRPPVGGQGHAPGATTHSSTRDLLHERRGRGWVASVALAAARSRLVRCDSYSGRQAGSRRHGERGAGGTTRSPRRPYRSSCRRCQSTAFTAKSAWIRPEPVASAPHA